MRALLSSLFALVFTPGCIFLIDDPDPPEEPTPEPFVNSEPVFIGDGTYWHCEQDDASGDFYFDFQAEVHDDDGDVEELLVTVYAAGDLDTVIDDFEIFYEGAGIWGGRVWEGESNLFCTEPIDVAFEAWDSHGGYARLLIRY